MRKALNPRDNIDRLYVARRKRTQKDSEHSQTIWTKQDFQKMKDNSMETLEIISPVNFEKYKRGY